MINRFDAITIGEIIARSNNKIKTTNKIGRSIKCTAISAISVVVNNSE
jgi:hypothetical protein